MTLLSTTLSMPEIAKTHSDTKYWLIIPAAGIGRRMGSMLPKQYLSIDGQTILQLTINRLSQVEQLEKIIVVLHPEDSYWDSMILPSLDNEKVLTVVGGEQRFHSVMNGLESLEASAENNDWVLVHDAVRPCVSCNDIANLIRSLHDDNVGGILAAPVRETLKKSCVNNLESELVVESTLNRDEYWLATTPQMFRYGLLRESMLDVVEKSEMMTDEASVVEAAGHTVKLVIGRSDNIKVTHPEDLAMVDFILNHADS